MNSFILTGMCLGMIFMMFWTPYLMAKGIQKLDTGYDLSFGEKALCFIPIINIIRAEKVYFGQYRLCLGSTILFYLSLIARILTATFMNDAVTICTISVVVFVIAFIFLYGVNVWFVYKILDDSDIMSKGKAMMFSIIYPLGQYYIGNYIVNVISHKEKKMETFEIL